jgi:hypothetical protein
VRELRTSFQLQARSSYFSPCLLTILTWEWRNIQDKKLYFSPDWS